jgi:hypothetical protein
MDDLLDLVDTIAEFWPLATMTLLTGLLAFWPKARKYAHMPALVVFTTLGALLAFQMGTAEKAAAASPHGFRCGLPFEIPFLALMAIGAFTLGTGLVLLPWRATRPVGVRVVKGVVPVLVVACTGAWFLGTWMPSHEAAPVGGTTKQR